MTKKAPLPGLKPLFVRPTSAAPKVEAPSGPRIYVHPRNNVGFSTNLVRWRGTGAGVVKAEVADPRMSTPEYRDDCLRICKPSHYTDMDVDRILDESLRGAVAYRRNGTIPVVHIDEDTKVRTDVTVAAYLAEKEGGANGKPVVFIDVDLGGAPERMWTGTGVGAVNAPKKANVTLMVACYDLRGDEDGMPNFRALMATDMSSGLVLGCLAAMRAAAEAPHPEQDQALAAALEAQPKFTAFELLRQEVLKAKPADWSAVITNHFKKAT